MSLIRLSSGTPASWFARRKSLRIGSSLTPASGPISSASVSHLESSWNDFSAGPNVACQGVGIKGEFTAHYASSNRQAINRNETVYSPIAVVQTSGWPVLSPSERHLSSDGRMQSRLNSKKIGSNKDCFSTNGSNGGTFSALRWSIYRAFGGN